MATVALSIRPNTPVAPIARAYQFSPKQYERMSESGILPASERVELLDGWVIQKMTQHPPHAGTIGLLLPLLLPLLPKGFSLRCQLPIALARSRPEPDLALVRGPAAQYLQRHPRPSDIALIIEVADSSLLEDRRYKGTLYARAKLPEFWLINLVEGRVEVFAQPKGGRSPSFGSQHDYLRGEAVPFTLDGKEIARLPVADLCPIQA